MVLAESGSSAEEMARMAPRACDSDRRGEMKKITPEQMLAMIEKCGPQLETLYDNFFAHKEDIDLNWAKGCVGVLALRLSEVNTDQAELDLMMKFAACLWQAGYEAAPKLEFVLPEGPGG